MTSLTDFLLARIAEEAVIAQAVADETFVDSAISTGDNPFASEADFAEHFTPARVLAECAARRTIVEDARKVQALVRDAGHVTSLQHAQAWGEFNAYDRICRALAVPYSDHVDYDGSWAI